MKVKPGYKQTGVGIVPEDWEVKSIMQIAPFQRGFDLPNSQLKDGLYPVVYSNGVMTFHDRAMARGPGVVTGRSGTLGKVHYVETDFWPHNTSLWVTRFNGNCQRFVFYLYSAIGFERFASGSGVPTLNRNDAHEFYTALPPTKAEQETIAEALSDADAFVESLKQLIAKKNQLKHGAMQGLLTGKKRLSGFGGNSLVATEIGNFPANWKLTRLGDIVDPLRDIRYGIVQPGKYDSSGRYMIRGQDYSKGWTSPSELFRVSNGVEERYKNARVKTGDLIITIVGTCGVVETIPEWLDGANLTQTTARVAVLPSKADSRFCKYMLQTEVGLRQVLGFMKGGVQPGLNCGDIEKFLIPLPQNSTEQNAIATILSDMDAEITALEAKLAKARQIKIGMMQELLTGKIRLV